MKKIFNESVKFTAIIETTYIPKASYEVAVRFGRKRIYFDPSKGRAHSIDECVCTLVNSDNIENVGQVMLDFIEASVHVLKRFYCDGLSVTHCNR